MPDLNSMIGHPKINVYKEVFKPRYSQLEVFLRLLSQQDGGKFLFHCNFNYSKLPISVPDFYKECIVSWASLNSRNPSSVSGILNQFLWNKRFICIDSRSVYNQKLIDTGFLTVMDFFDSNENLMNDGTIYNCQSCFPAASGLCHSTIIFAV